MLVGRDAELERIASTLDRMPAGLVGVVIEGDVGVGRTALWKAVVERTAFRVLASRPSESDAELPYAALGDLLEGVSDDALALLPAPQRRALELALLRIDAGGAPLHRRAVALAVLGLTRSLAEPVLIAVDDAHWLDEDSARVLEFALRRAERLPVGVLLSCQGRLPLDLRACVHGLLEVRLEPLELDALARVLRTRVGEHLQRPQLKELHRLSGGNPLFALELAREDGPQSLQELIERRLGHVPSRARDAVLAVSTLARPRLSLLEPVLEPGAVAEAVDAGFLEVDSDRIWLTHPVLGSMLYAQTPPERRRDLHRRLAAVAGEPEERARQLALATEVPDAVVAAALDEATSAARSRGAPDAAGRLADHAVRLTPAEQPGEAWRRTLAAAEHHFDAGALARARGLLERLTASAPAGRDRADALVRLAEVTFAEQGWAAAVDPLAAALADAGDTPHLAAEIERRFAWGHHMAGDLAAAAAHARSAVARAEELGDPTLLAATLANRAFLDFLRGDGLSDDTIARAVELEAGRIPILERPSWLHALMLHWSDDVARAHAILERLHDESVERGDDVARPFILNYLARIDGRAGDLAGADQLAHDALEITRQTGQDAERAFVLATCGVLRAQLGDVDAAQETLQDGLALATRTGMKPAEIECLAALGAVELALGNAAEAHAALGRAGAAATAAGFGEPAVFRSRPDEIEALVALGRLDEAEAVLGGLERRTGGWVAATALRCRGLLLAARGEPEGAVRALTAGLDAVPEPFERARTLLALGVVHRRNRQKAAARAALEEAQTIFEALPAPLWAGRASAEAARLGGRPTVPWELTETERRVAELVATGRTNREVADALFVSVKTVEWNLSKVYRKLDVRSRTELAAKLGPAAVNAGDTPGS
jgi:DNA-binding NarL/FixJ family response regulator